MIANILFLFLGLGSAVASLAGVDPNTLKCDPTGRQTLHLPHFTDCNKFFMCAHGAEVEFTCAEGTIFDFPLQVCNWPWATKCYLRTKRDDDIEEGSGEEDIDVPGGVNIGRPRPFSSEVLMSGHLNCQSIDGASRRIGFKGDCQRYWSCTAGSPHASYCTDGLFFNEEKQECDFEANVKCVDDPVDELHTEFIEYK
ncbi:unnamed protein product [Leptosia nina]|uniref:Chitin-binding type-2 domain-containing protein n=1 Tax=Leptosia nina TaxID=320188 RepID=A0AAV1JK35_9NEOP